MLSLIPVLASSGSVVDLDGTFVVQIGIFLVIWFVLAKFYFGPVLKALDARHEGTVLRREHARKTDLESDAWASQVDTRMVQTRSEAATARAGLLADAERREREVFENAEKTARERVGLARTRIQSDVEDARKELRPKAELLAVEIASKVLGRRIA